MNQEKQKLDRLTSREAEIAHLLHDGKKPKDVARALGIGSNTVRAHQNSIYKRLEIHSIQELVLLIERAKQ